MTVPSANLDILTLRFAVFRGREIPAGGIDYSKIEPHFDKAFLGCPNTVLPPHVGSITIVTRNAISQLTVDNLKAWMSKNPPPRRRDTVQGMVRGKLEMIGQILSVNASCDPQVTRQSPRCNFFATRRWSSFIFHSRLLKIWPLHCTVRRQINIPLE